MLRSLKRYDLSWIILLTAVLTYLYVFLKGTFFEGNDDPLFAELLRGTFYSVPTADFFIYHRFLSYIYAGLYKLTDLPWYSIFMFLYFLVAVVIILYLVNHWIKKCSVVSLWYRMVFIAALFYLLFADQLFYLSFTRISILLCASAVLLLHSRLDDLDRRRPSWRLFLPSLILFTLGLLTRPQSAILVFGLLTPFVLFSDGSLKLKRAVWVLIPFAGLILADKALDLVRKNEHQQHYKSVIPYLFNILDAGDSHYPANATPADIAKYQVVASWHLSDKNAVNPQFLSRVADSALISFNDLNRENVITSVKLGISMIKWNYALLYLLTLFAIMINVVVRSGGKTYPELLLSALLVNFFFLDCLIFITVCIKMVPRVLEPSLIILIILNFYFLLKTLAGHQSKFLLFLLVPILAALPFKVRSDHSSEGEYYRNRSALHETVMTQINAEFKDKLKVFTLMTLSDLSSFEDPFHSPIEKDGDYLIIDGGWTTLVGEFEKEIITRTGRSDYLSLINYLKRNKEKIVFISTPDRNMLISSYLRAVYGAELSLREIRPYSLKDAPFGFYTID